MHYGTAEPLYKKDTLNKEHLTTEETVCSPDHLKVDTNLPLN